VCGSCGALLQTDVCQPDDAPVWDIALAWREWLSQWPPQCFDR